MRIGSLFSGYGGLDLAVAAHFGATVAWHVEFDKWPSAILAHHYPDIPNYGDVTQVDWAAVEPVDIITGGFPCQDVSHAGLRAGVHQGTRSGLWFEMARAIDVLKPWKVVIENVAGLLSADAASTVEPCPWCVGDEPDGHMRALGAVLADLAEMGLDARWGSVRAADAGAAHGRLRVFIVATDPARQRGDGAGASGSRRWAEPTDGGGDADGPYTAAIARWEQVMGRPAPSPTEPGNNGRPRLSPRFVEWMMGLPDGWVTGVSGITRSAALKALGNGVVPQQAALALDLLDGA